MFPMDGNSKGVFNKYLPSKIIKGIFIMGILNSLKNQFYRTIYQEADNVQYMIQTLDHYVQTISKNNSYS